jgi:hypothetical protein
MLELKQIGKVLLAFVFTVEDGLFEFVHVHGKYLGSFPCPTFTEVLPPLQITCRFGFSRLAFLDAFLLLRI